MIFDSQARLPLDSNLVETAPEVPLIVIVSRAAERPACESLRAAGAEVIVGVGGTESERVVDALDKAGRDGHPERAAGGRPAAGRVVPRRRPDRRDADVHRADRGRRSRAPRCRSRARASESIAESQRALSLESRPIGEDLLIEARLKEW